MVVALSLLCFLGPLDKRQLNLLQQVSIPSHALVQTDCWRRGLELFGSSAGITGTSTPPDNNEKGSRAVALVPPPYGWCYPNFESIADTISSHVTMDRSSIQPGENAEVYILEQGFLPHNGSWMDGIRVDRMRKTSKVLYRPKIVHDLVHCVEELLASKDCEGLLVKGSEGVGKSYSLINLSRYLMASEKYWVTIIPDCYRWKDELDFFKYLLQSVGVDPVLFGLEYDETIDPDFASLIHDIDTVLSQLGRKWVFIFDQINAIFARERFEKAKDVNRLKFPFAMITRVLKPGRIISILSASCNNHVSHREHHEGFAEFDHPTQFHTDEIHLLYPQETLASWDWEQVVYATGLVPWYLHRWASNPKDYFRQVPNEIQSSLVKLQCECEQSIPESVIQCLLCLPSTCLPLFWDRKYSQVKFDTQMNMCRVVALFPLVEDEYRKFFGNDLFRYMMKREWDVRRFCYGGQATQHELGRFFKELVVARFGTAGLTLDDFRRLLAGTRITIDEDLEEELGRPADKIQLGDIAYLEGGYWEDHATYLISIKANLLAVDVIIRVRKIVIGIRIHTCSQDHGDVVTKLMNNIQNAQWNHQQVEKVILVYLSPTLATKEEMERNIGRQNTPSAGDWVVTRCCTIQELDSLRSLEWFIDC